MTKSFTCSSCNSQKTSAVKIKGAWGPIGRIVDYPGLGYEVTCHELDIRNSIKRERLLCNRLNQELGYQH